MNNFFNVYLNSFPVIFQAVMHLLFTGRLTGKKTKPWYFILYLFLLYLIERVSLLCSFSTGIPALGMELTALYTINRFLSGNSRSVSWTASALAIYISQLSFGIINSIEAVLFPFFVGKSTLFLLLILAMPASYLLCAACYIAVLHLLLLTENQHSPYLHLLLFPVLFFFSAELYVLQTAYSYSTTSACFSLEESGKHLVLLLMQVLGLGALFCIQYAYQHICRSFQAQAAFTSLTQAVRAQKTYIAEAQIRYEQTKAFRHDIKNHLSVLDGLLNSERTEEAKNYLQKLETFSASLSFPYQTGNPVVDILLSEKLGLAQTQGIRTEVSLLLPRNRVLDDFDLCVIFSNALDNAVEACRRSDSKDKFIRISGKQQGSFYLLEWENTCSNQPLPAPGTGLSNIRAAAEKYCGTVQFDAENGCFSLRVLLNLCFCGNSSSPAAAADISVHSERSSGIIS